MSGRNLRRDEAQERAQLLDVASYDVQLDFTTGGDVAAAKTFTSHSIIRFAGRAPGTSTWVDVTADALTGATLNGVPVDGVATYDGSRLHLTDLAENNELVVDSKMAYMRTGEGVHRFVDPIDGGVYLYSQFEAFEANRMYACFDQPDLKAAFRFAVTAPSDWVVVSNGAVAERPGVGQPGTWRFTPTPVMSTYITALVAGPYESVHDHHDGIDLGLYCRASLLEHLDSSDLFEVTRQGLDFFHRTFKIRYPFGKYDQLFVPEMLHGAMENAGAVTVDEGFVFRSQVTDAAYQRRAMTLLHEMAHMWFGNLVTMRWWDDLWLNESFATYASVLCQAEATRWTNAWTTFADTEKTWAYRQDQLPSTHPIAADMVDTDAVKVNFDGITYAKGASVLRQLVTFVGQAAFLDGVRAYFKQHAWRNTSLSDLLTQLTAASGRDLSSWSAEWLETAGVNTLRPQVSADASGRITAFAVLQEAPAEWPTLRGHRLAIGLYDLIDDRLVRTRRVEVDVQGRSTSVPELVGEPRPALVLINDDDLTYAKTRLDPQSLTTLVEHITAFTASLPRALCWAAAWDMTRDAEMPARDYLALVLRGAPGEDDVGAVESLLQQAQLTLEQYADPTWSAAGRAELADAAREQARSSHDPDLKLAFARCFIATATSAAQVDFLVGLLDGSVAMPGLSLDAELRWTALQRLVRVGRAGEDAIAAEEATDPSADGLRHAASCRAAIPTATAKEQAWAALLDGALPNTTQAAVIAGFVDHERADLMADFVDRYFAAVARIWATHSAAMAQNWVVRLYPSVISDAVVAQTDTFLTGPDVPAGLARLLREGRDGHTRALRARAGGVSVASGGGGLVTKKLQTDHEQVLRVR